MACGTSDDGLLLPDISVPKKPSIYIDEHAERFTKERLAAVLMFPGRITEVQRAHVEQSGSERRSEKRKGTLYTMPKPSRSAQPQPLRILPAQAARGVASQ
jgi:hypothetical protein